MQRAFDINLTVHVADVGDAPRDAYRDIYDSIQAGQWSPREWLPSEPNLLEKDRPSTKALIAQDKTLLASITEHNVRLPADALKALHRDLVKWSLSQSLHGEQGALHAATLASLEATSLSLKMACAAQALDEARHVAVFQQYLLEEFGGVFPINNSFEAVIDAITTSSSDYYRYAGMQIVVEGLALSGFGNLMRTTSDPRLRTLLHKVLEDEARHVRIGLERLSELIPTLTEAEQLALEQWILEISRMMFERFNAEEVREKWFGQRISKDDWRIMVQRSNWLGSLRAVMRTRLRTLFERAGFTHPRFAQNYDAMLEAAR